MQGLLFYLSFCPPSLSFSLFPFRYIDPFSRPFSPSCIPSSPEVAGMRANCTLQLLSRQRPCLLSFFLFSSFFPFFSFSLSCPLVATSRPDSTVYRTSRCTVYVRTLARGASSSVRGRKIIDLAADLAALDDLPPSHRWLFAPIARYVKTETLQVSSLRTAPSVMLRDNIEQSFATAGHKKKMRLFLRRARNVTIKSYAYLMPTGYDSVLVC